MLHKTDGENTNGEKKCSEIIHPNETGVATACQLHSSLKGGKKAALLKALLKQVRVQSLSRGWLKFL